MDDLKQLIHKKQYQVLKLINSETINLYWEIGEEIYRQQEENGWGKSIVRMQEANLPVLIDIFETNTGVK